MTIILMMMMIIFLVATFAQHGEAIKRLKSRQLSLALRTFFPCRFVPPKFPQISALSLRFPLGIFRCEKVNLTRKFQQPTSIHALRKALCSSINLTAKGSGAHKTIQTFITTINMLGNLLMPFHLIYSAKLFFQAHTHRAVGRGGRSHHHGERLQPLFYLK